MDFAKNFFLKSVRFEFWRYKTGHKTFAQLDEKDSYWKYSENDNSFALVVKHMVGNMLNR